MLINPDKMRLVYKGVRFKLFELERKWDAVIMNYYVKFYSPVCANCLSKHGLEQEEKEYIEHREEIIVSCGVDNCDNQSDFLISFDFGFEEGDVEEGKESGYCWWEEPYEELNFD
jgi:hypothetical protein